MKLQSFGDGIVVVVLVLMMVMRLVVVRGRCAGEAPREGVICGCCVCVNAFFGSTIRLPQGNARQVEMIVQYTIYRFGVNEDHLISDKWDVIRGEENVHRLKGNGGVVVVWWGREWEMQCW